MSIARIVTVASVGVALAAGAAAQSKSNVQIVQDGKTTTLAHVVAGRYVAPDGKADIRLLFATEAPQGPVVDGTGENPAERWAARDCQFGPGMSRSASKGCSSVLITFKEAEPEQYAYTIRHGEMNLSGGGTLMNQEQHGAVQGLAIKDGRIGGTLNVDPGVPISGRFDAVLDSVTAPRPVTGASVAQSAQARALLDFHRAMHTKDFATAQKHSASDVQKGIAEAKEMGGDEFVEMMAKELDPKATESLLESAGAELVESGDTAQIRVIKKTDEGTRTRTFRFVKVGAQWKVE